MFLFPRGKTSSEDARHWSDESTLRNRAFFRPERPGGRLVLDGVRAGDEGEYRWNDNWINLNLDTLIYVWNWNRCRVDFGKAPTRIERIGLGIVGELDLIKLCQVF